MDFKKIYNLNNLSFIILVTLFTFLIWYIFLGYKVINQPYIWDDLNLIRSFSLEELIGSWTGNWDSSGVETPSYRPVTILFYNFIGSSFNENYLFLRIFTFLLMIGLMIEFNWILIKLDFGKKIIFILSFLIIFTKIYTTLLSWLTLSALIFCYLLALLSIIFFINWLTNKKNHSMFFSILFAFLCIFSRETMYILPGIIYLILIYKQKKLFKNIKKNFLIISPFLIIVIVHLFLRTIFIKEGSHFDLSFGYIKFGDENISLGNLIKTFKASWLPMGLWSIKKIFIIQSITFFTWIISIFIGLFLITRYKSLTGISFISFAVFILLVILLNLPSVTVARPFDIMLPTLIVITLVSFIIESLFKIKNIQINNGSLRLFCNLTIILILLSGICGGYFRSNEHIKAMNIYSARIIYFDAMSIYDDDFKKIKISKNEYDKKVKHLQSLNINNWNDVKNLNIYENTKIFIPNFSPLEF